MTFNIISSYNHLKPHRIALLVAFSGVFLCFGVLASSPMALAQEDLGNASVSPAVNPYVIKGVNVDITADNAVEAREQAFEVAQVKAYEELARRLLSEDEMKNFKTPSLDKISAYVKDYEVTNEKLSAVRYNGTYKISFSKRALGKFSKPSVVAASEQAGDILILPYFKSSNRFYLWQGNPFLQAWARARDEGRAGRAIVPLGDVDDVRQVRVNQALNVENSEQPPSFDPSRLNALRIRYKAKETVLITAKMAPMPLSSEGSNTKFVDLQFFTVQPYGATLQNTMSMRSHAGEGETQFFNRIVERITNILSGKPQREVVQANGAASVGALDVPTVAQGPAQIMAAQYNFSSMREWVDMKRTLEAVSGVSAVRVQSMSPRSTMVAVIYNGAFEDLSQNLNAVGIGLTPMGDGQVYQIARGSGGRRY